MVCVRLGCAGKYCFLIILWAWAQGAVGGGGQAEGALGLGSPQELAQGSEFPICACGMV